MFDYLCFNTSATTITNIITSSPFVFVRKMPAHENNIEIAIVQWGLAVSRIYEDSTKKKNSERRALFSNQLLSHGWFKRYFAWSCAMLINTSISSPASCVTTTVTIVKHSWPVFCLLGWPYLFSVLSFTSEFSVCGGGKSLKNTINFFPSLLVCGGCRP